MDPEVPPYASLMQRLSATSNSNEARLKLLERRLTGELPSPRSLTFGGHHDLQQSDLDDVSSSRLLQLPADSHSSDSKEAELQQTTRSSKKRKVSPDADRQDQRRQQQQLARSPPFRQVTNREVRSPVAKHSPLRKSPALASPLSSKLLQRNTINKYFTNRGNSCADGCLPVGSFTQTDVSFQEQEQNMHAHLLTAFKAAEDSQ